ncbi:hypothetical protein VNO77_03383 [Canavalia gladiata]|uniref:Uncharacterized protein n=1 Tax=Canavalia gladiata TaxID=3824 RepID=A0AAN9MZL4_CANGL
MRKGNSPLKTNAAAEVGRGAIPTSDIPNALGKLVNTWIKSAHNQAAKHIQCIRLGSPVLIYMGMKPGAANVVKWMNNAAYS